MLLSFGASLFQFIKNNFGISSYCSPNSDRAIAAATGCIIAHNMKKYPVVFSLLVDDENKWLYYLKRRAVFRMFNQAEMDMFSRFISRVQENDYEAIDPYRQGDGNISFKNERTVSRKIQGGI